MNRLTMNFFLLTLTMACAKVVRHAEADHYPRYAYKYEVNDPITKDIKKHWEARDGDLVKGSYSLVEPDGKLRVVDYWADDANGFNADVQRLGARVQIPATPAKVPVAEVVETDIATPANEAGLPLQVESVTPLTPPVNYGFGAEGGDPPLGQIFTNVGTGSHRWDPKTGSYGGWVPLLSPTKKYAMVFSKKYIDGKLHKVAIGPISLVGRTLVFKVKH